MREWLQRDVFFYRLPHLLKGEDPEFAAYFQRLAHEVRGVELPRQNVEQHYAPGSSGDDFAV